MDSARPASASQSEAHRNGAVFNAQLQHPDHCAASGSGSGPPAWVLTDQLGEPRHRHWHWLTSSETWGGMVAAELHNPTRLRRLARRLWPGRPPYGDDDPRYLRRYGYSRREIADLIAAAMAEAAETAGGTIRRRGAGR